MDKWKQVAVFSVFFVGLVVGAFVLVPLLPPGCQHTHSEDSKPSPPIVPANPLARFREDWNSEAKADWPVSEHLASMSSAAYLPEVEADAAFRKLGFERTASISVGSQVAYLVFANDIVVVAFRGTDDTPDWLVNLDVISKSTPHGGIHKGFSDAYDSMKSQIIAAIKNTTLRHVWITGHSLGGALALVCAYDLAEKEKITLAGVMTFGQPMVARPDLAEYLNRLLLRKYAHFVNNGDIVTRIPPLYEHCGSLVWFTPNGVRRSDSLVPRFGAAQARDKKDEPVAELKPLTPHEFEQLKSEMRQHKSTARFGPDGKPIVEGQLPGIKDHPMQLYLEKVRSLLLALGQIIGEIQKRIH